MGEPTIKLMESGYWHVRWNPDFFAQWQKGSEPTRENVFCPGWNWETFSRWWELNWERFYDA